MNDDSLIIKSLFSYLLISDVACKHRYYTYFTFLCCVKINHDHHTNVNLIGVNILRVFFQNSLKVLVYISIVEKY